MTWAVERVLHNAMILVAPVPCLRPDVRRDEHHRGSGNVHRALQDLQVRRALRL